MICSTGAYSPVQQFWNKALKIFSWSLLLHYIDLILTLRLKILTVVHNFSLLSAVNKKTAHRSAVRAVS